jgi:hypothetical protein
MALISLLENKERTHLLRQKLILNKALQKNFSQLKAAHIKDYQSLFKRVELNLGVDLQKVHRPTDERLKQYAASPDDYQLQNIVLPVWKIFNDRFLETRFPSNKSARHME